jgi:hypothetical protein
MVKTVLDALLNYQVAHVVIVLAQGAVLLWVAGFRKGIKPILVVNLIVAATVLLYNATRLPIAIHYQEYRLLGLVAFECGAMIASAGALLGVRIPAWLIWLAFGVNLLLSAALMIFMLTFKMTRLI